MIYTSYFAMIKKFPENFHPVSIARYTPKGINIPNILQIAPTNAILSEYKDTHNEETYIKRYTAEVLEKHSVIEFISMIQELTDIPDIVHNPDKHIVLCCYEKSEDFCHRHLFADYCRKENISIREISLKELENYTLFGIKNQAYDNTVENKYDDIGKYMLKKQADLAAQYKYKPLPPLISKMQRQEYEDNLPEYWKNYKEGNIYTLDGVLIATGLTDRKYVCGDYGIFLEIDNSEIVTKNIMVKKGQEYRINDPKYSEHVKYQWFCPKSGTDAKLYFQQKGVACADYKPGKWYVSPYEVIEDAVLEKLKKDENLDLEM